MFDTRAIVMGIVSALLLFGPDASAAPKKPRQGAMTAKNIPAISKQLKLGKTITEKDWAAGCDNGLSCQAVALMPADATPGMLSMVITRSNEAGSRPSINIYGFDSDSDRYRLVIDGVQADTGAITDDIAPINVTGSDALKLARALASGSTAEVYDGGNILLGKISLAGSAGALRYIDAKQTKVASADLFVKSAAIGKSAMAGRDRRAKNSKGAKAPVVAVRQINPGNAIPSTPELVALVESSKCSDNRFESSEEAIYSLGNINNTPGALALVSCGNAENKALAVYIGTQKADGKWQFNPAQFDYDPYPKGSRIKDYVLDNAKWNAATQSLTSFQKKRVSGDCGQSADYVWDGAKFRIIHIRMMEECRGSLDWITIWRADIQLQTHQMAASQAQAKDRP
jgi:hypothetical protein